MRKVFLKLKMKVEMAVDEGVDISEVVSDMYCQLNDTATTADILDSEITDYEVVDSK